MDPRWCTCIFFFLFFSLIVIGRVGREKRVLGKIKDGMMQKWGLKHVYVETKETEDTFSFPALHFPGKKRNRGREEGGELIGEWKKGGRGRESMENY